MPVVPSAAPEGSDAVLLQTCALALAAEPGPKILGLAVSGGSDSMAMLHLMARAAPQAGWQVRAVTVDHGLRKEAADEARFVSGICAGLGVPHDVVKWTHHSPRGNVMDQAARARYALIAQWARGLGIDQVALAHTATDQAETFLMGLARMAGLDGLTGMRAQFFSQGVRFLRPFLQHSRADLRGYLTRHALTWTDDPTNENEQYTRTKARRALKALAPLGITEARLAGTVNHLAMAQTALRRSTVVAAQHMVTEQAGALWLDRRQIMTLDPEFARRIVILCVMWLTRADYPPRAASLDRVLCAIIEGKDATLAGAHVKPCGDRVLMVREPKALGPAVTPGHLWDGRWRIEGPAMPGAEVRALGAAGLTACKDWRQQGLAREILLAVPALWQGEHVVGVPALAIGPQWSASVSQSFNQFILSH